MSEPTTLWPSAPPTAEPRHRPSSKAEKLALAAKAAADVRAYDTNPDVIAYRIERMRTRVDRLIWTGLVLGLAFTAANVQAFAARGAEVGSIEWCTAWLLDPMVSLVLVGVLLGEQVIARHQIKAGPWVRRTKWVALGCTYAMNTWSAWASLDPSLILLHSVPPAIVFCAAEAVTDLRHWITEAVRRAYRAAAERLHGLSSDARPARTVVDRADVRRPGTARSQQDRAVLSRTVVSSPATVRAESLRADSDLAVEDRTDDGVSVLSEEDRADKPSAPVEQAAYRAAVVAELREEMLAAIERGEKYEVTWRDVEQRTGYRKRWCEGVLAEARRGLLSMDGTAFDEPAGDSADADAVGPHGGLDRAEADPHGGASASEVGPHGGPSRVGTGPHGGPHRAEGRPQGQGDRAEPLPDRADPGRKAVAYDRTAMGERAEAPVQADTVREARGQADAGTEAARSGHAMAEAGAYAEGVAA
ncbi:hypothetical protein ABZU32_06820 [Sphaerisporangium sp. NPDC005288]|uniref:hypothetical protein n=1 Tax=Sphaerisporangium sp. NPDC005288 TaxID=3155114 RepID=UPI0033A09795